MLSDKQLTILQGLINQAIKIDPMANKRLEALDSKSLRLQCSDPSIDIQVNIEKGLVSLNPGNPDAFVDTHILGDITAFIQVLTSEDKTSSIINSSLTVKGDSQLLVELQQALMSIEFDWEYHLAKIIGDLPAHQFGKISRQGLQFLKHSSPVFKRHLQEFLLEETRLLPQQNEVDTWINDIQQTSQQLERVEALLAKAKHKIGL